MSEVELKLSRAHIKRLRNYTLDGIDVDLAGFGHIQIVHSENVSTST